MVRYGSTLNECLFRKFMASLAHQSRCSIEAIAELTGIPRLHLGMRQKFRRKDQTRENIRNQCQIKLELQWWEWVVGEFT